MENSDYIKEILKLKKEKNAVILAHNYQRPEIQDIADFVGDSLGLSIEAGKTKADIIIFCGVDFMAETAKILNPDKKVLIPEKAMCPMAMMLSPEEILTAKEKFKSQNPAVVLYVNTHASCKALSDYACTSANTAKVINSIASNTIIFGPDANLADYVRKHTNKNIIAVPEYGNCPTHHQISVNNIKEAKTQHPDAKFIAHPECTREVLEIADFVGSTEQMIKFVKSSDNSEFIVGTEIGIIYRLRKENPNKKFEPASKNAICPNMKMTTLESVYNALKFERYEINLDKEIMDKARKSIERMIAII
ncbi:MAG: quinolinate synthase [Candidatus Altiarchaeales archaeon A3]|nr:MAG: quinolinate synthase [Candidatus Altiarchaeales archaeon A3]